MRGSRCFHSMDHMVLSAGLSLWVLLQIMKMGADVADAFLVHSARSLPNSHQYVPTSCRRFLLFSSTVSRADAEEILLLPNQRPLLEDDDGDDDANLGSTSPAQKVLDCGVARCDRVLSKQRTVALKDYIDRTLQASIEEVESFRVPRAFRFANVLEKQSRWDLLLPFDDADTTDVSESSEIMEALGEVLSGRVGELIEDLLGEHAILYELSCLISDPGSRRQEIHPDILVDSDDESIPVLSCFVALQDIETSMGPTTFIKNTVSIDHQTRICNPEQADDMLRNVPSFLSTLNAGDCSVYDPRMLHAGGSNRSTERRRLLTISFLRQNGPDPSHDLNPGSIRPDLKSRKLTLSEMKRIVGDSKVSAN